MAEFGRPTPEPYSGLEVLPKQEAAKPADNVNVAVTTSVLVKDPPAVPESSGRGLWRRNWVWIACVAAVVVAAVVGGTVGGIVSRRHSESVPPNDTTGPSTTSPAPTMSGTATALSSYLYPTSLSWGYPHLEVLALSSNRSVHWKHRSLTAKELDDWQPAETLSLVGGIAAEFQNGLAAVIRAEGTMDIFMAGSAASSYGLFHKYHNESLDWEPVGYDNWTYLGGILSSGPIAVSSSESRLDVFVIGASPGYELFQKIWNDNVWSDWINLGGSWSTYAPTAVARKDGRIDVFVVNPVNKALYHRSWDGSTWQPPSTFTKVGGYCASRPVAISLEASRIDVFVRGGDASLWHLSSLGDVWSDWTSISGKMTILGEPSAAYWGPDRLDVFAWGSDDSLFHKSFNLTENMGKGVWTPSDGFETIGKGLTGPPKAVSDTVGSLHVFGYTQYGQLVHRAWNQSGNLWTPEDDFEVLGTIPQSVGVTTTLSTSSRLLTLAVPAGSTLVV